MEKAGLIGLSTSRGFISKAIRWFRKDFHQDPPSHAFVVFGELCGELIIGESTDPKLRLHPLKQYVHPGKRIELWEIEGIDKNIKKKAAQEMMIDYSGKWYGINNMLGFVWVWLNNKFGKVVRNPWEKGVICSEYAKLYLDKIGYDEPILQDLRPDDVAPDTIRKSFEHCAKAKIVGFSDYDSSEIKWGEIKK